MILDRFRVTGQVAVVTGAGRGTGAATAVALAQAGADAFGRPATERSGRMASVRIPVR